MITDVCNNYATIHINSRGQPARFSTWFHQQRETIDELRPL
jgi:hypothetical protein